MVSNHPLQLVGNDTKVPENPKQRQKAVLCIHNFRSSKMISAPQQLDPAPGTLHGKEATLKQLRRCEDRPLGRSRSCKTPGSQVGRQSFQTAGRHMSFANPELWKETVVRKTAGKKNAMTPQRGNVSG